MPIPVVPCTPDHCGQTDVPMIFRSHTPRTCTTTQVCTCAPYEDPACTCTACDCGTH